MVCIYSVVFVFFQPQVNTGLGASLVSTLGASLGTGLGTGLGFSGLMNPALTTSGFAPPGIAIPQLASSLLPGATMLPGIVIPQLATPLVATSQLAGTFLYLIYSNSLHSNTLMCIV